MYLLDTNILSEVMRRVPNPRVLSRLSKTSPNVLHGSLITLFELRYGARKREDHKIFWHKIENQILPLVDWLPFKPTTAVQAGDLSAHLELQGQIIGVSDTLIAATALEHKLILVTRNTSHFQRIPDLQIENWFEI